MGLKISLTPQLLPVGPGEDVRVLFVFFLKMEEHEIGDVDKNIPLVEHLQVQQD